MSIKELGNKLATYICVFLWRTFYLFIKKMASKQPKVNQEANIKYIYQLIALCIY